MLRNPNRPLNKAINKLAEIRDRIHRGILEREELNNGNPTAKTRALELAWMIIRITEYILCSVRNRYYLCRVATASTILALVAWGTLRLAIFTKLYFYLNPEVAEKVDYAFAAIIFGGAGLVLFWMMVKTAFRALMTIIGWIWLAKKYGSVEEVKRRLDEQSAGYEQRIVNLRAEVEDLLVWREKVRVGICLIRSRIIMREYGSGGNSRIAEAIRGDITEFMAEARLEKNEAEREWETALGPVSGLPRLD